MLGNLLDLILFLCEENFPPLIFALFRPIHHLIHVQNFGLLVVPYKEPKIPTLPRANATAPPLRKVFSGTYYLYELYGDNHSMVCIQTENSTPLVYVHRISNIHRHQIHSQLHLPFVILAQRLQHLLLGHSEPQHVNQDA